MGLLEDWDTNLEELNEIIANRPSLRGILIGFLAEYKLSKLWFSDKRIVNLVRYDNHDRQKHGDFGFVYKGVPISVQVKSLQTKSIRKTESGYLGTFQCDASDRRQVRFPKGGVVETTCLLVGGFDLLAVNLFGFGNKWRFAFAKNQDLPRTTHKKYKPNQRKNLLATSMRITWPLGSPFREEPFTLLDEIVN
jgi:hypothetical protein